MPLAKQHSATQPADRGGEGSGVKRLMMGREAAREGRTDGVRGVIEGEGTLEVRTDGVRGAIKGEGAPGAGDGQRDTWDEDDGAGRMDGGMRRRQEA